ncbi:MAG: hypothetical protein EZS28_042682 [Streblomastix strix]|uniref:Uncharacterized protein n=1 Tax=Streblomastix strix TaxID=222440 RepID=A0A5J4TUU4_9EUKA|nr:MAG: hypothetical protein EZS28_042682 [Streblomastix strix]
MECIASRKIRLMSLEIIPQCRGVDYDRQKKWINEDIQYTQSLIRSIATSGGSEEQDCKIIKDLEEQIEQEGGLEEIE